MIDKSPEDRQREACAEEGAFQPPSFPSANHHRTRNADIKAAQEAEAKPRNFVGIARISQDIKEVLRHSQNWHGMPADQREALEVIATGMALIVHGQANKAQSWNEIAEQAAAIAERVGRK